MKEEDEFFVPYIEGSLGNRTKSTIKKFAILTIVVVGIGALIFSLTQKPFKNSSFELTTATKIVGIYHESPYPMLKVKVQENLYKNIVLLGFGKSSAHPFLEKIKRESKSILGKMLAIEGNLIYYNGKTLIQITSDNNVSIADDHLNTSIAKKTISTMMLSGEIIDPKCYFGVMKPGKGKIHRSCAVRCISGGIPPVLATTDENNIAKYFLITDINGNPIHESVLPFVGKPAQITGIIEQVEDWYLLKIHPEDIIVTSQTSNIY